MNASHIFTCAVHKQAHLRTDHVVFRLGRKETQLHALARILVAVVKTKRRARNSVAVKRIQGAFCRIAISARTFALDFATESRLFDSNRIELLITETRTVIVIKRNRCFLIFGRTFQAYAVLAGREPEAHGATRFLVKFGDKFTLFVANEQVTVYIFVQVEACARAAQIGHHHIAGTRQVHVAAGVLGATHRSFRFLERFVEGKLISFRKRHLAVTADIARAAKAAHQRVREEGTLEFVAFLARLILSAAGDKGVAFHVAAFVDHERRDSDTALRAGNSTRAASVNHGDFHIGMQGIHTLAEFLPAINFFTEAQSLFISVAAVIHQHFFAGIRIGTLRRLRCLQLFIERIQLALQRGNARFRHTVNILLGHAAHLRKHIRKGAGIAFGVTQHRTALTAVIRTHGKHVTVNRDLARIRRGMGIARRRQNSHQAHQAENSRTRQKIAEQNFI